MGVRPKLLFHFAHHCAYLNVKHVKFLYIFNVATILCIRRQGIFKKMAPVNLLIFQSCLLPVSRCSFIPTSHRLLFVANRGCSWYLPPGGDLLSMIRILLLFIFRRSYIYLNYKFLLLHYLHFFIIPRVSLHYLSLSFLVLSLIHVIIN